jgi:RNA polymerase sigma factor (sigma-70 family)
VDEDGDDVLPDQDADVVDVVHRRLLRRRVRDAVDDLPAKQAQVIGLRYLDELEQKDIADAVDLQPRQIRNIEKAVLVQLRSALGEAA